MADKTDRSGDNVTDAVPDDATASTKRQRGDDAYGAYPGEPFEEYAMNKPKRGVAIIMNNKKFDKNERTGSDVDLENLKQRFTELGFDVRVYVDLKANQMKTIFKEVARENHDNNDCFICALMSHGDEGIIYGCDQDFIEIQDIIELFHGHNCRSLAGKPKIFVIQACRGHEIDSGVVVEGREADAETENVHRIPRVADILIADSVIPGNVSYRNIRKGSWFVQALSIVLRKYGQSKDLMSLLTEVNRLVASRERVVEKEGKEEFEKQMPCITSTLTKTVYFRPKK